MIVNKSRLMTIAEEMVKCTACNFNSHIHITQCDMFIPGQTELIMCLWLFERNLSVKLIKSLFGATHATAVKIQRLCNSTA